MLIYRQGAINDLKMINQAREFGFDEDVVEIQNRLKERLSSFQLLHTIVDPKNETVV
ncbi:hypothetical protein TUM19329_23760 [Legionella antarctica]|uniref:Uncharacterized protein n=1 Tax=Legionella antarctica TaxID=2708020 RepID=A0A6F8T5P7_9GAMM|nr:hypothetical protein [Legionella antarctica]BCA96015.1 hypothetical protein TUM19329_23760 [Legionella antarctica]